MNGDAHGGKRVASSRQTGKDAKRYAEVASLEELRNKVRQARSKRASLHADIARLRSAPSKQDTALSGSLKSQSEAGSTNERLGELSIEALQAEERCILYRTSGWTVFEIDLDIGRRERALRTHQSSAEEGEGSRVAKNHANNDKRSLGLGVRLDTFWRGRFYEPFYLVFAQSSQLVRETPVVSGGIEAGLADQTALESGLTLNNQQDAGPSRVGRADTEPVRLLRHTIPHFVPLQALVRQYLPSQQAARGVQDGGLDLLKGLMSRQGLFTFLGHLHSHLQAYVARREQTIALSRLALPAERASKLVAHGNDAFAHLSIRWDMPVPTESDVISVQRKDQVLRHANSSAAPVAPMDPQAGDERISVRVEVRYADFAASHLGAETSKETDTIGNSKQLQAVQALSKVSLPQDDGLACAHGSVLVQLVRHRVPAPRRGGDGATTLAGDDEADGTTAARVSRRREWERVFCERDLDRALHQVLVQAWKDEMMRYDVLDSTSDDTTIPSASRASHDLSI